MIKKKTDYYLRQRLQYLSGQVVAYKKQIDSAKTQLKKDYFDKKLKKAQKQAIDILVLIQRSQSTSNSGLSGIGPALTSPSTQENNTSTELETNVIEDN